MGKHARIAELERQVAQYRSVAEHARGLVEIIAQVPEDAAVVYTLRGQKMGFEYAKAARVLLGKMNG